MTPQEWTFLTLLLIDDSWMLIYGDFSNIILEKFIAKRFLVEFIFFKSIFLGCDVTLLKLRFASFFIIFLIKFTGHDVFNFWLILEVTSNSVNVLFCI